MNIDKDYKVLRICIYDENATRFYDLFRGGFVWSDETPGFTNGCLPLNYGLLVEIIAYRASLTAGKPRIEFEEHWNTLKSVCPSWPGFREERIYGQIERDYKAVKIKEDRCLKSEELFDDDDI